MVKFNSTLYNSGFIGLAALTWNTTIFADSNEVTRHILTAAKETQFSQVLAPVASSATKAAAKPNKNFIQAESVKSNKKTSTNYVRQSVANSDFWFYDSALTLYSDLDYDGYYYSFSVEFDVDTVYNWADVYAVVYLGNDDYFDAIHVTSDFSIYGDDSNDSFTVDIDLLSGFRPQDYEVLIELYDATTHELLAYSDGYQDADLIYVPLESENYEVAYVEEQVVVVTEHGGSMSWLMLIGLGAVGGWRAFKHYQQES